MAFVKPFIFNKNNKLTKQKPWQWLALGFASSLLFFSIATVFATAQPQANASNQPTINKNLHEGNGEGVENNSDPEADLDNQSPEDVPNQDGEEQPNQNTRAPESTTNFVELGTQTGIFLQFPDFNFPQQAQRILNTYGSLPSNIITEWVAPDQVSSLPFNNIVRLLKFDENKWDLTNSPPEIYNLGARSSYINNLNNLLSNNQSGLMRFNLGDENNSNLPALTFLNTESEDNSDANQQNQNQFITSRYLDQMGVLALQITLSDKNNQSLKTAYYILLTGFNVEFDANSNSPSPLLNSSAYLNGVDSLTDQELVDYLSFTNNSTQPSTKALVSNSRLNNVRNGRIDFTAQFGWKVPDTIGFNTNFAGIVNPNNVQVVAGLRYNASNEIKHALSWQRQFSYAGFQPESVLTNQELIFVIVGIVAVVLAIAIAVLIAAKSYAYFRNRKT